MNRAGNGEPDTRRRARRRKGERKIVVRFSTSCCLVICGLTLRPVAVGQVAPAARRRGLGQRLGDACEEIAAECVERERANKKKERFRLSETEREADVAGESARELAGCCVFANLPCSSRVCVGRGRWGFSELALTVDNDNASAQQLYAKTGYQVWPL